MRDAYFKGKGSDRLHYVVWDEVEAPVAVLQIVHGMVEYAMQYDGLAKYLNTQGIIVVGDDHLGHGLSADPKDRGYFGRGGCRDMVENLHILRGIMTAEYPRLPYLMMGHSMGSFLTREYISKYGDGLAGAIIAGTCTTRPEVVFGVAAADVIQLFHGARYKSRFLTLLTFGRFAKSVENPKTPRDWLTRDEKVIAEDPKDPLAGFIFSVSGYRSLFRIMNRVNRPKCIKNTPAALPLLFVSGLADPVGDFGKGIENIASKFRARGSVSVSVSLYEDMRHELHKEIGKEVVFEDLGEFILAAAE